MCIRDSGSALLTDESQKVTVQLQNGTAVIPQGADTVSYTHLDVYKRQTGVKESLDRWHRRLKLYGAFV